MKANQMKIAKVDDSELALSRESGATIWVGRDSKPGKGWKNVLVKKTWDSGVPLLKAGGRQTSWQRGILHD